MPDGGITWPTELSPLNEVRHVAAYLHCSRGHVFKLIKDGDLLSLRVGHRRVIPRESIEGYIDRLLSAGRARNGKT